MSGVFAQGTSDVSIVLGGEEDLVKADLVSGSYFSVLGLEPAAGRLLTPADDVLSSETAAAVISDRYWQRRFGRSPSAIGTSFTIRDRVFTIVGVTPAFYQSARTGGAPDLLLPLLMNLTETQRREPTNNWLSMLGRLKPGATPEQADAEVHVAWSAFLKAQAAGVPEKERASHLRQRASAFPAADGINPLRYDFSQSLLILMGTVGLVLLLACVNLSGLLLARAASRQREVSIRLAIGAGRARLVRQFLTESLMLAVIGGAVGLLMAEWFSARLVTLFANGSAVVLSVAPDWRVLAFTATVSLAACVVAGLAPALHAMRAQVNPALKEVRGGPWPALQDARRGSTRDLDDPDRWSRAFSGDAHQAVLGGQGLRQRRRARRQRQEHASVPGGARAGGSRRAGRGSETDAWSTVGSCGASAPGQRRTLEPQRSCGGIHVSAAGVGCRWLQRDLTGLLHDARRRPCCRAVSSMSATPRRRRRPPS